MLLQRFASEKEGDREVQRTMLELLNQLDGFSSHSDIKVGMCVCVQIVVGRKVSKQRVKITSTSHADMCVHESL